MMFLPPQQKKSKNYQQPLNKKWQRALLLILKNVNSEKCNEPSILKLQQPPKFVNYDDSLKARKLQQFPKVLKKVKKNNI